jgi:hypothetical protein
MRKLNMAREATQIHQTDPNTGQPVVRKRRTRSPSPPRPAFFIIQVLGEDGTPMLFDKKRIKILSVERSAEKVLELVESGQHDHAFYLRGIVPAGRAPNKVSATD